MDLDFTITDEWVGLSKQEQQQHLFLKQKGKAAADIPQRRQHL